MPMSLLLASITLSVAIIIIPIINSITENSLSKNKKYLSASNKYSKVSSKNSSKEMADYINNIIADFPKLKLPSVSICIPMRNEAKNIPSTLTKFLSQVYPAKRLEFIIMDDNSTDNSYKICKQMISDQKKLNPSLKAKLIRGKHLPTDWMGKSWALHQAAKHATGDLLLFFDCDVFVSKTATFELVSLLKQKKLDFLSCFPRQIMKTWGEKFTVPVMSWGILTFHPLPVFRSKSFPKMAIANGQCILIKRSVYDKIGGHEAIKSSIVDDVSMSKLVKKKGYQVDICFGNESISCRMYRNLKQGIAGFAKSAYRGADLKGILFLLPLVLIMLFYFFAFLSPFLIDKVFFVLLLSVIFQRLLVSATVKENVIFNIVFFPLQLVFFSTITFLSYIRSKYGEVSWKGRSYKIHEVGKIKVTFDISKIDLTKINLKKFNTLLLKKLPLKHLKELKQLSQDTLSHGVDKLKTINLKPKKTKKKK